MEMKYEEQSKHTIDERIRAIQEEFLRKSQEDKKQMEILQKSLEDANRKAQQGSMQIQGEVREDELKSVLQRNFPPVNGGTRPLQGGYRPRPRSGWLRWNWFTL